MSSREFAVKALLISSGIVNPLILFINPYLFIAVVAIQFLALAILIKDFNERVWVMFLCSFLYYGITVFFFKIYDLFIILFLVSYVVFFRRTSVLRVFKNVYVLMFCVWLLFMVFHIFLYRQIPESKLEFARYVMSFLVVILFSFKSFEHVRLDRYFLAIVITSILQVIMVYFITYSLDFEEVTDKFLKIEIFTHATEHRGVGFFRDPAKYYVFLFFIIIVADELERLHKREVVTNVLIISCFVGSILALSRAAIIGLAFYVILRYIRKYIFRDQHKLFYQLLSLVIFLALININLVLQAGDYLTYQVTAMTGRTGTLETEGKITEGNRMNVWLLTLEKIKEKPLLGHALGINSAMTDNFYEGSSSDYLPFPPHNTFLSLLYEMGVLGLVFFLIVFFPILKKFYQEHILFLFILPLFILDMQGYRLYSVLFCIIALKILSPTNSAK